MTIVELYDSTPINNIIGALTFAPEKIVYIGGFSKKQFASKKQPILEKYLLQKQLAHTVIEYVQVRKDDLHDIIGKLEKVYTENTDCRFNIEVTGGDDLMLVAIGVLCQRHPEIQLFQISSKLRNIKSFSLSDVNESDKSAVEFSNTVEDNLILHGSCILSADGCDCLGEKGWNIDEEFIAQINIMWDICCSGIPERFKTVPFKVHSYPNMWNKVTSVLMALDGISAQRDNSNIIQISEKDYIEAASQYVDVNIVDSYLEYLMYRNLLMMYSENGFIFIEFENDRIRNCFTKSGNILELKTYILLRKLFEDYRADVRMGVTIDWDGDIPDENQPLIDDANTINEVDIIASVGITPYFISCKNGRFTSDELYKLDTVAERFGTGYAKKVIITTDMQYALNDHEEVILQRAADMGIVIVDNVHHMTDEEFADKLVHFLELPKKQFLCYK